MLRGLVRATLPLTLCKRDEVVGQVPSPSPSELCDRFRDKTVLTVGGTKGIGKAASTILSDAGAKVTVVGRSATPPGVAADLSTVSGCIQLVASLAADAQASAKDGDGQ